MLCLFLLCLNKKWCFVSLGSVHPCTCTEECGCEGVPTVEPCPAKQVPKVSTYSRDYNTPIMWCGFKSFQEHIINYLLCNKIEITSLHSIIIHPCRKIFIKIQIGTGKCYFFFRPLIASPIKTSIAPRVLITPCANIADWTDVNRV